VEAILALGNAETVQSSRRPELPGSRPFFLDQPVVPKPQEPSQPQSPLRDLHGDLPSPFRKRSTVRFEPKSSGNTVRDLRDVLNNADGSEYPRPASSVGAVNPTDLLSRECIAIFDLFGVPYVQAPGEAEAQVHSPLVLPLLICLLTRYLGVNKCAELAKLGLVDGIITDDSDIFAFLPETSSVSVYRHVFRREKDVELYATQDIVSHIGLTPSKIVCLAQLLGCDYCGAFFTSHHLWCV
jgi:XPG I-region